MGDLISFAIEALAEWGGGRLYRIIIMLAFFVWGVIALFNGSVTASLVVFAIDFAFLLVDLKLRRNARVREGAM